MIGLPARVALDGPWPTPAGGARGDRAAAVPITGVDGVLWWAPLPNPDVQAITVGADGTVFVAVAGRLVAVRDGAVHWSAPGPPLGGCVVLAGGLLGHPADGDLVLLRQADGAVAARLPGAGGAQPSVAGDRLVGLAPPDGGSTTVLGLDPDGGLAWRRAVAGTAWRTPVVTEQLIGLLTDDAVEVLDHHGEPVWRHRRPDGGELPGALVGMPGDRLLVPVRERTGAGLLLLDPLRRSVRRIPVSLPATPGPAVAGHVLAGADWMLPDARKTTDHGLALVDLAAGTLQEVVPLPVPVVAVAGDATGAVACAASPNAERWSSYRAYPGSDDATRCLVTLLRSGRPAAVWAAPGPITGPIAVGAAGELLVPVDGRLAALG